MTARTKDWPCRVLSRARGVVFVPIIHQTMFYDSLINARSPGYLNTYIKGAMGMAPDAGGGARARARLWRMYLQYVVYYVKYRYGPVGCGVPEWGS